MIKRYLIGLTIGLFICFAAVLTRAATTYYVVTNNTLAQDPYTNWGIAGTNIIDVVNAAMTNGNGNTVLVSNGTYVLTNQICITNGLTVQGFNGRTNTFIDGNRTAGNTNRGFYINHASAVVTGVTISNAGSPNVNGGGVYCNNGKLDNCFLTLNIASNGGGVYLTAGTVTNCTIITNRAVTQTAYSQGGGGVFMTAGNILNCIVMSNQSRFGGGTMVRGNNGNWLIYDCVISCNTATFSGGGIYLCPSASGAGQVKECLVSRNYASTSGGGVGLWGSDPAAALVIFSNCTFSYNTSPIGGGIGQDASYGVTLRNCLFYTNSSWAIDFGCTVYANKSGVVENCTIVNNGTIAMKSFTGSVYNVINSVIYSNSVYDPNTNGIFTNCCLESTNNLNVTLCITNNPQFVDFAGGNYRLVASSPCVNTGTNQSWMTGAGDLDGRQRIRYGTVDIGAYETIYEGTICKFGF